MSLSPVSQPNNTVVLIVNQAWVAWKFRSRLMQHLRASGWHVVVMTDMSSRGHLLADCCDETIHIGIAPSTINPVADLSTLFNYWRHLRALRPAAVLSFTIKPNIYGALACRASGIPIICNVTGLGSVQGSGRWVGAIVRGLYKVAFAAVDWVFFQNANDAAQLVSQGLVRQERSSVLPGSGVDTGHYLPTGRAGTGPALRFCMAARLLRDKGVAEYAEAARIVRGLRPQARFELWGILEASDERYVSRAQIGAWEAEQLLVFRGEAPDALAAFADADAVVAPSYYPEGLPRTLLEAASMGLPAITTDLPGCRDAVVHGVSGLVCEPRNIQALADCMMALVDMAPAELRAMGEAARRRVLAQFDERIVLDQYSQRLAALGPAPAALPAG